MVCRALLNPREDGENIGLAGSAEKPSRLYESLVIITMIKSDRKGKDEAPITRGLRNGRQGRKARNVYPNMRGVAEI